ncbi:MAG: FKBP-type peptidyl-prolyl cis-trans isomerase N-terminal domain-containing protein [Bullifex sp.]
MKKRLIMTAMILLTASVLIFASGAKEIASDARIVKVIKPLTDMSVPSLLTVDTEGIEVIYHFSDKTSSTFPFEHYKGGEILEIRDNGIMTMSLPGQTTAVEVRDITLGVNAGAYSVSFPETASSEEYPAQRAWNAELADDLEGQFAYTYGYELVSSYMSQGLTLRGAYFAKGVLDFWTFTDPFITVEEMNTYLNDYLTNVYGAGVQDTAGAVPASFDEINALSKTDDISEMFSYSYGYYISFQLYYSGFTMAGERFADGALHALFSDVPLLGSEERESVMTEYTALLQAEYDAYVKQLAAENLSIAENFLADNAKEEGVITTASGLQYKVMAEGSGAKPSADSTVTLTYTLNDIYGNTIDQGTNVQLSLSRTIAGFSEAVTCMKVGDTIVAYIHPDLGYGEYGSDAVEPNALLIFEIELVSID